MRYLRGAQEEPRQTCAVKQSLHMLSARPMCFIMTYSRRKIVDELHNIDNRLQCTGMHMEGGACPELPKNLLTVAQCRYIYRIKLLKLHQSD